MAVWPAVNLSKAVGVVERHGAGRDPALLDGQRLELQGLVAGRSGLLERGLEVVVEEVAAVGEREQVPRRHAALGRRHRDGERVLDACGLELVRRLPQFGERARERLDARLGEHLLVVDRDAEVVAETGRVRLAARLESCARAREVGQERLGEVALQRLDPLRAGELPRERPVELGDVRDVRASRVGDDELRVRGVPARHDVVDLHPGRLRERRDHRGRDPVRHEHVDRLALDVLGGLLARGHARRAGHGQHDDSSQGHQADRATLQPVH